MCTGFSDPFALSSCGLILLKSKLKIIIIQQTEIGSPQITALTHSYHLQVKRCYGSYKLSEYTSLLNESDKKITSVNATPLKSVSIHCLF